jgi:hypothetical protein
MFRQPGFGHGNMFAQPGFAQIPSGGDMVLLLVLSIGLPLLVPGLLLIPPAWKLCSRAGFPRWFSFAMIIPLANLTLLYFIAFSQWPSEFRSQRVDDGRDGKNRPGSSKTPAPAPADAGFTSSEQRNGG